MKIKSIKELESLPNVRYIKRSGTVLDVKWEHNSDLGWAAVGNDWSNASRDLIFQVSYYELIRDCWVRI